MAKICQGKKQVKYWAGVKGPFFITILHSGPGLLLEIACLSWGLPPAAVTVAAGFSPTKTSSEVPSDCSKILGTVHLQEGSEFRGRDFIFKFYSYRFPFCGVREVPFSCPLRLDL